MRDLSESTSFLGVEVDVVDPERGIGETEGSGVSVRDIEIGEVVKLDVDFDFVVLEGDEGGEKDPGFYRTRTGEGRRFWFGVGFFVERGGTRGVARSSFCSRPSDQWGR